MLLEFSFSNYKSIRQPVLFSMLAGSDTAHEECMNAFGGQKILKSAVVYGANGSGKSNFINALAFARNLVLNSIRYQPGKGIDEQPFKLDGYHTPSMYRMQLEIEGIRYLYQFSLQDMLVKDEYLYYFPNKKQTKIFERHGESFSAGRSFRGKFDTCRDVLKPNRLLLSCAANFSSVQTVAKLYGFFRDDLVIYFSNAPSNWMDYSLRTMATHPDIKEAVITFMQELGMGLQDIEVKIEKHKPSQEELPPLPFLAPEFRERLLEGEINRIDAKVVYKDFKTDLMSEESNGVRKLFAFLCPFLDIMKQGKILVCDELEAGLHESIVYGLLRMFLNHKLKTFPQLIFTTHDTGILNLDLFRRDQIWFTELREDRSTDLYSLAEIKRVRKDENWAKGYIRGKYGAIPMLNLDLAKILSDKESISSDI